MNQPAARPELAHLQSARSTAAALLVYQAVLQTDVGQAWQLLLQALCDRAQERIDAATCLRAYGAWFRAIAAHAQSWPAYLRSHLLTDVNPFTEQAQRSPLAALPPALVAAARHDLRCLQQLARLDGAQLSAWLQALCDLDRAPVAWDPPDADLSRCGWAGSDADWAQALEALVAHYQQQGVGQFARYRALRWQGGALVGVAQPDPVRLSDLVGYEAQQQALRQNTEALLQGAPALHVLLYGSRGSGKSSLVKALLPTYGDRGLRLVEVTKADLPDLPAIVAVLRDQALKFVVFVDDLSFEADEVSYKALKAVLEGTVTARQPNVVVYATSNRRHLIREFLSDRPSPSQDEIHAWDTVQETLSLSDRFGLTLTFEPADQPRYLAIVQHLAAQAQLNLPPTELERQALQWATRHNGRSGRTARQFIDFLQTQAYSG